MTANAKPSWMPTFEEILDAMNAHDNEQPGSPHLEALISRAALDRSIFEFEQTIGRERFITQVALLDRLAALRAEREALP